MNARTSLRYPIFILFVAAILLLSACGPVATAPGSQPTQTAQPSATLVQPTQPPAQPSATLPDPVTPTLTPPAQSSSEVSPGIFIDYSAVAQDVTAETVPAHSATDGGPYWEVMPEYRLLTLQGYPINNHLLKPQIYVYPVNDLAAVNENAGQITSDLQALLQTQQSADHLPFLPFFNASQVFHAQVQYLDFTNGKGVRFLTQFDQAFLPVNNYELFYTFQGLTADGKYYIAAVLPVTNPLLPDTQQVSSEQAAEMNDFSAYLTNTINQLEQQPAGSFTPSLDVLDALIRSIEIK